MALQRYQVPPTDKTPAVVLDPDGIIEIKGRGFMLRKEEFPEEVYTWIDQYMGHPADITRVYIAFEYLNSVSASLLTGILKKLNEVILQHKKLVIKWFYEEDDTDLFERGEYISETLKIPIQFVGVKSISDYNISEHSSS